MKPKALDLLKTYAVITLGALVYAVSFVWCYDPNHIGFGGVTGIAQIINAFVPVLPIGIMVIVFNAPLFLLGWKLLGGHLLVSSLYAMALSSVFIDGLNYLFPAIPTMEPMLAAIFGGVLLGVGLGLVFSRGATTGGTDLLARLLKLKFAWLPVGKLLLVIDLVVVLAVAAAFRSMESGLYGLVGLYISTVIMDKMLYGMDTAKVAYIISDHDKEIARAIVDGMERGVTILAGKGAYSGQPKEVLMCAFKQRQIVQLKALVKSIDPAAFLIVCDAHEVLGDGFREYKQNDL